MGTGTDDAVRYAATYWLDLAVLLIKKAVFAST